MTPRLFYSLALYLILPFALVRLVLRARQQRAYLNHWSERFGYYTAQATSPIIWLHAVSVGEARAAQPLVSALRRTYPTYQLLLTYMTPTGRQTGIELFGDSVRHAYLPYDLPGSTQRFLRHFQPKLGIMMETEIWPNLIYYSKGRSIPLILANARLSLKSQQKYQRYLPLFRPALRALHAIAAQTIHDANRFRTLGAATVTVTGNLKFDVTPPATSLALGESWRATWGKDRPVLLAASTRDGEEALILAVLHKIDVPELLTILVPRHPQRFSEVAALLTSQGLAFHRRSLNNVAGPDIKVILGDSMGEMFSYYAACDIAFIGGSLLPFGGQNLIEACAVGKAVLLGPHTYNFSQASEDAIAGGAALRIVDEHDLAQTATGLFKNPARLKDMREAALKFATKHQGATAKVMQLIKTGEGWSNK